MATGKPATIYNSADPSLERAVMQPSSLSRMYKAQHLTLVEAGSKIVGFGSLRYYAQVLQEFLYRTGHISPGFVPKTLQNFATAWICSEALVTLVSGTTLASYSIMKRKPCELHMLWASLQTIYFGSRHVTSLTLVGPAVIR